MKIIAFSKYLSYMLGGAEKSTYALLKKKIKNDIEIVSFNKIDSFCAEKHKVTFPKEWHVKFINDIFLFKRFTYWEYLFNRSKIRNYFNSLEEGNSILYTYAIYAPIAVISFRNYSKLFIRSETDLGINKNYHCGIKKYLKYIYMILEFIPFYIYKKDLKHAIKKAEVVCNSKYMAQKLKDMYNKESTVLYPFIDEVKLKEEFDCVRNNIENKGIVFVGDAVIKGSHIAKNIADKMPQKRFYFFSRFITEMKVENNITWLPWQKREVDIYKYASCVIVPSIWEEAYGRVSREAYVLDIPVLVSNIGGLPESVNYEKSSIIDEYKDINIWVKAIEKTL